MNLPLAISIESHSERQTMSFAATLAQSLRAGDVVTLDGPLGSGKTAFVRGLASGLGLDAGAVSSPTFVICQEYTGSGGAGDSLTLVHIDAYRLSGPEELETIGWSELLHDRDAVIAIEWPSRIAAALPEQRIDITFEHLGSESREITLVAPPSIADRLRHLHVDLSLSSSAAATAPQSVATNSTSAATCRTCGKPIDASSRWFPFCSERCRLADLGRWFSGDYRVSRSVQAEDELEA